jgi:hypothetical protein
VADTQSPVRSPSRDIECVALVKTGSPLARGWNFDKPVYGIYEYSTAFDKHTLRFGDGSWQDLISAQLPDLILLDHYGTDLVETLFEN